MFLSRVKSFLKRSKWLGTFLGGQLPAALYMVRTKFFPNVLVYGRYGPFRFLFRPCDLSALKEVLIDQEYVFLREWILSQISSPVVLDIGAHIGLFSLWAKSVRPDSQIMSIEASPGTFEVLEKNAKENDVGIWRVRHCAAWRDRSGITFANSGDSMGHKVSTSGQIIVPTATLTDLMEQFPQGSMIDVMKVDIEGAEEAFLCTHPEHLARVKALVIELHPNYCDTNKVRDVLAQNFSKIEEIGGRKSSKPLLFCRKG